MVWACREKIFIPVWSVAPACTSRRVLRAILTAFTFDDEIPSLPHGWRVLENTGHHWDCSEFLLSLRSLRPAETRTTNPSTSLAAPVRFVWGGNAACSQESAPSSQTEGQLEKVLLGLRLWIQSGSFFLLLIAELMCGAVWPPSPSLLAHLKHSLIRDLTWILVTPPSLCQLIRVLSRQKRLFSLFFFSIWPHQKEKKVWVFKKIKCVILYNLLCQFIYGDLWNTANFLSALTLIFKIRVWKF